MNCPRNPTDTLSALDCYQSVDYVRKFGLNSLKQALTALAKEMETGILWVPKAYATRRYS
jgi:hypothetical protein